jgi:L-alanine-DL-glutamate epimerase-like enolase superfamily enzyme
MQIREITIRQLNLPLVKPYRVSFRTYTEFEPIVVEIHSAHGQIGWGEVYVPPGSTRETTESAWRFYTEYAAKLAGKSTAEARSAGDMNGFLKPRARLLKNPLPFKDGRIELEAGYWPEVDRNVMAAHQVRAERIAPVSVA